MDAEKIYDGVREKRGEALVFLKAIEEMGELIFSLSKFMGEDASFIERVQEEIADVIIMMEQLKIIFFSEEIDRIRQEKVERLETRLNSWIKGET